MYKISIFTFKAFIYRTPPLYLCELIEQVIIIGAFLFLIVYAN